MEWYKQATLFTRAVCIGSALGIGFLVPWLWPVGIVGVFLTMYDVRSRTHTLASIIGLGAMSWFVKSAIVLSPLLSVYPIDWLPITLGRWEIILILLYWLSAALWLSFGGVIVAVFLYLLSGRSSWSMPMVWLAGELSSALLFSVALSGVGTDISTAFSIGSLGYLLAEHNILLLLARWGGVYLLLMVYVGMAVCFWYTYIALSRRVFVMVFLSLLVLAITTAQTISLPALNQTSVTTRVATVTTSFTVIDRPSSDSTHQNSLLPAVQAGFDNGADYVLLPEGSQLINVNDSVTQQIAALRFLGGLQSGVVIDSGIVTDPRTTAIRASAIDFSSPAVYQADKQYLVPQGEYIPRLYNLVFRSIGLGPALDVLYPAMSFQPGPLVSQGEWSSGIPGVLFCYESIDPLAVRRLVAERNPPFIAHILSHAWFHHPTLYWQQTDQMLRVQAVWNQIAIVSAGNYGPSKAYLPDGRMVEPTIVATGNRWSVGIVDIPIRSER